MAIIKHQGWHLSALVLLVVSVIAVTRYDSSVLSGSYLNMATSTWLFIAITSAIAHQIYVLVCWRSELYFKSLSKLLGSNAFSVFKVGFAILILSRPLTVLLLAFSNAHTLNLNKGVTYLLSAILTIPLVYLFYSLRKYFGVDRAFGIDHFYPEKYRNDKMVNAGIFKYSSNAMYVYGFLLLWIPGILLQSKAALLAALFHHIYIWVHYFVTELHDMKTIYSDQNGQ